MIASAKRWSEAASTHRRIVWALLLRELSTRYGRDDIGFLWLIAEPLIFAGAVSIMWSIIKPPFEHGIRIVPFVVTGYMPLILIRQTAGYIVNAVKSNQALLYHRQISPLHLFVARFGVEFVGVSLSFIVIVLVMIMLGLMNSPLNILLVFGGWFLLGWIAFGIATIMGALSEIYDFVERFVQVITYIVIPLSGSFYMAAWIAPQFRRWVMVLPFIHCVEMIRGGFFGEFVKTYFDIPYVMAWGAGLTLLGLALVQFVRGRVEVE